MKHIDKRMAVHLLRVAVRDYGVDHAMPHKAPAFYFHGNQPLCIVGVALELVGLRRDMLMPFANFARVDSVTFAKALAQHNYSMTDGAVKVFRAAQSASDDGAPWGEALQEAEGIR